MLQDSAKVFDDQAVSSTTAFISLSSTPSEGQSVAYVFSKTGNASGTLKLQVNNLTEKEYKAAVNSQVGATFAIREVLNTTGWVDADLSPTATIAIAAGTDPHHAPIMLVPFGFKRCRLVYTNATNSGTINAYVVVG